MELRQDEVDEKLKCIAEFNTFIERYQTRTTYGKFSRIFVTIKDNCPTELISFRVTFELPVAIGYCTGQEQVFIINYRRIVSYRELKNDMLLDAAIREIELKLLTEFKKLMTATDGIEYMRVAVNEYRIYYDYEM